MRLQNISPSVSQTETFCWFREKWSCETSEQCRRHQREPFWHWNELDPHLDPWCVFDPRVTLNHVTSGKSPYNLLSIQDKVYRSAPVWRRPACRCADRKFLTGDNKLQNVMWCCCLVQCVHDLSSSHIHWEQFVSVHPLKQRVRSSLLKPLIRLWLCSLLTTSQTTNTLFYAPVFICGYNSNSSPMR